MQIYDFFSKYDVIMDKRFFVKGLQTYIVSPPLSVSGGFPNLMWQLADF